MANHTPGPWRTAGLPVTPDSAHWPVGAYHDGQPVMVATVDPIHDDGQPGGACEANARLIAAAPRLLDACEAAIHELRVRRGYKRGDAAYDALLDALIDAYATPPPWLIAMSQD